MEHKHNHKLLKEEEVDFDTVRVIEVCECGHTFTMLVSKAKRKNFKGR